MSHFERLGLPVRFDLEPAEIERAFLVASRAVHPDHHFDTQDDSAAVNAAYNTLRDPFRRAEYLLSLTLSNAPALPPDTAFLAEMMDVRERAEAGDMAVAGELMARLATLAAALSGQFENGDHDGARKTLSAAKTTRSLLREVASV